MLKEAARVATDARAELTVLDVVERIPLRRRTVTVDGSTADLQTLLLDERCEQLAATVHSAGVDATVDVVAGEAFVEVSRYATLHNCDLVMVGASLPVEGRARVVGPDITRLIRACPTPVWVMRHARSRTPRILALVDPDPHEAVRDSLNHAVLDIATSISRRGGAQLHVAHAWQLPGESAWRSSAFVSLPDREVDLMVQAARAAHRDMMDRLAREHGVGEIGGQTHLVRGAPDRVLPGLAERLDIDLIVVGTMARRGLRALVVGNTAETMMRATQCSVVIAKPHGFVLPRIGDGAGPVC